MDITAEQFEEILDKDRKMGLGDLQSIADFRITNDSTREKLVDQTIILLKDKLKYKIQENTIETKIKVN